MSDSPLRIAHQHAANADDAQAQGQLVRAAEEHQKASDTYALAGESATDDQVKRTLKMLQDDHSRSAKDLERRIAKLREEGKDPNVPQPPASPKAFGKTKLPDATHTTAGTGLGGATDAQVTPQQRPLIDSHNEVDESFMLLAGTRSDPGDLFNQFWNITQGMLDHLSQPVAFATAPLTNELEPTPSGSGTKSPVSATQRRLPKEGSVSSDTDAEEQSWVSKKFGMGAGGSKKPGYPPPSSLSKHVFDDEFEEEFDPDDLSESFCLVNSGSDASAKLKKENTALKAELEATQKKLASIERVLHIREERDQQLKDSIVFARREAQRGQVQRMNASAVAQRPTMPGGLDLGALNLNVPPPMANNPGREAQYTRRIRELEDELRATKNELRASQAENEKQKAMIAKYKERWDKLKESSKKKKEARAATGNADQTKEKIVEEPTEVPLA